MRYVLVLCALVSSAVHAGEDIDAQGFIHRWLILGPLGQAGGANPGETAMRRDYLTDGVLTEGTIDPTPGMIVDTKFNGAAASTGLIPVSNPSMNPTGKPTWFDFTSSVDTIDFQEAGIYSVDIDRLVTYAVCYVENLTGAPLGNAVVACASDDAIQVLLGGSEVWINNVARGVGGSGAIQDRSPPFSLPVGLSRLMVKVFEGGGGTGFRLRLEQGGQPLLGDKIAISVEPFGPCVTSVGILADSWLREVTFVWPNRFSKVEIRESGVLIAQTQDTRLREITLSGVGLGDHRYQFRSEIGPGKPACAAVDCFAALTPVWPREFACAYADGVISFAWRNAEGYYDSLKIQRGGADVLDVSYGVASAQLASALAPGTYTFELVAGLGGYKSSGITCQVEVTGPPPEFRRGDANADGAVNVADAAYALAYLFAGGPALGCPDAGDGNDDGVLDISDAIAVLRYLFAGAAMPLPGGAACGADPTLDGFVACDYPAACN